MSTLVAGFLALVAILSLARLGASIIKRVIVPMAEAWTEMARAKVRLVDETIKAESEPDEEEEEKEQRFGLPLRWITIGLGCGACEQRQILLHRVEVADSGDIIIVGECAICKNMIFQAFGAEIIAKHLGEVAPEGTSPEDTLEVEDGEPKDGKVH